MLESVEAVTKGESDVKKNCPHQGKESSEHAAGEEMLTFAMMYSTSISMFFTAAAAPARWYTFRWLSTFSGRVFIRTGESTPRLPGDIAQFLAASPRAAPAVEIVRPGALEEDMVVVVPVGAVKAPPLVPRLLGDTGGAPLKGNFV
jgi:hypothetical protein